MAQAVNGRYTATMNTADSLAATLPLAGRQFSTPTSPAAYHAGRLLRDLGAVIALPARDPIAEQLAWARSGAMALTGRADGPPLPCTAPLAARMQGGFLALQTLAPDIRPLACDPAVLLGERAAIAGHSRQGAISPGGSCHLLAAADGWLAINLPRDSDWQDVTALLKGTAARTWPELEKAIRSFQVKELCDTAKLLGLAVAPFVGESCQRSWCDITAAGPQQRPTQNAPRVVDLSSLWAGPLCSHLLQQAGAQVIKVESLSRPDGARQGPADFFDLLNAGKQSVALDFNSAAGIQQLQHLIASADIVIEASRPRALQQMGIQAEDLIRSRPGLTWVSITGYGRNPDSAMRIAYGDDAAVAAGLSAHLFQLHGERLFGGDAIADPLTGMHAALAAMAGWQAGGGYLLDISLQAVVADCLLDALPNPGQVHQEAGLCQLHIGDHQTVVEPPQARPVTDRAHHLGADTSAVLQQFNIPC